MSWPACCDSGHIVGYIELGCISEVNCLIDRGHLHGASFPRTVLRCTMVGIRSLCRPLDTHLTENTLQSISLYSTHRKGTFVSFNQKAAFSRQFCKYIEAAVLAQSVALFGSPMFSFDSEKRVARRQNVLILVSKG